MFSCLSCFNIQWITEPHMHAVHNFFCVCVCVWYLDMLQTNQTKANITSISPECKYAEPLLCKCQFDVKTVESSPQNGELQTELNVK